jgi:hypothetical protein
MDVVRGARAAARACLTRRARPARAAAAAALAAACGAGRGAAPPDGPPPAAAEPFAPGVISDAREQWRLTFTPDGREAYFAASDGFFPRTRRATIYVARRAGGGWTAPEVAPFSGRHSDIDPHVAPDGRRLYFASIRPAPDGSPNGSADGAPGRGDVDLWVVERAAGGGWGEPARLGPEVNGPADELYPSADADGTLYFASGPPAPAPGLHFDVYRARRRGAGFAPREALGPGVNRAPQPGDAGAQDAWDFNPEVSADGRTLVFTSLRPGGRGLGDLYVSRRRGGAWGPARALGPAVNTAADEYHPTLARDGRALSFVRRGPRPGDFYRIATRGLGLF